MVKVTIFAMICIHKFSSSTRLLECHNETSFGQVENLVDEEDRGQAQRSACLSYCYQDLVPSKTFSRNRLTYHMQVISLWSL